MCVPGRSMKGRREEPEMWEKEVMLAFDSNLRKSHSELFPSMYCTPSSPPLFFQLFHFYLKMWFSQFCGWKPDSHLRRSGGSFSRWLAWCFHNTVKQGSGDVGLGYCRHQMTFNKAQKRHSSGWRWFAFQQSLSAPLVRSAELHLCFQSDNGSL